MDLIKLLSSCLVVLTFASGSFQAFVQESTAQESAKNAPIYLDEPEAEPPARVTTPRKKIKETYEDKTLRAEREAVRLSDDRIVSDGKYIEYYRDGQKYAAGSYKMGVLEGDWKYWFPNGQLCKQISFKNGKADGQWEVFNKEGILTAKKGYQAGKRHGKWINYHKDGEQPRFEISYEKGLPVGERITYFTGGQKRQSVNFKDGKMDGPMTEWDESGKKRVEAIFKDGKLVGEIKRYTDE